MKQFIFLISLLIFIGCNNDEKKSSTINLDSVDMFFEIADKLEANQAIKEAEWDSLFITSGYKTVTRNIYSKEEIKEIMTIAFDKQRKTQRDTLLAIPMKELMENELLFSSILVLDNFVEMHNNWKKLKDFRKSYDFATMETKAINQLRNFLVNPIDSLISFPSVSMVCMDREARSLTKGIVVDFNLLYRMPDATVGILAHEMFHTYRSALCNDDYRYSNSVVAAIELLLNEGLADQVDKKDPMQILDSSGTPEEVKKIYKQAYDNTPKILEELDVMAMAYIKGEIEQQEFWQKAYNHIAFEGHPNGFYMTSVIKKHGLLNELIENMTDPVEFAKIYNKAAKLEGIYTFSDELIGYLEKFKSDFKK